MIRELIICDGCGEPFFFPDLTHHWDRSFCAVCERDQQQQQQGEQQ
jgi:formylmethanofuran dehydrogenase subunit E